MFKTLSNWWNRDKLLLQQQLEEQQKAMQLLQASLDSINKQREDKQSSTEPWVEIRSADFDPVKGFKIELDWNDAFIQHLKDSGLQGRDDEVIVQKWLGFLYGNVVDRLESTIVDKSDTLRPSEYL